ncbi:MAG: hypothetical protein ED556_08150 [Winogradskyella sp.]|uniref:hypothetical protein n=1 Tax=Winogradskyella sp. TaxID=1883156 RepID=UPI000F3FB51F|nr:hypothetical protein [Winogradskyella sp.]RNC86259.1 MAG: hypothetical protein ED556_08150 [Winogradskyella sp.]
MKTIQITVIALVLALSTYTNAQQDLSQFNAVSGVYITSYWGDVNVKGVDSKNEFNITATYTNTSKKAKTLKDVTGYLTFEVKNKKLFISARAPKGFESIDMAINLPNHLFLEIELIKGGNIYASNVKNGVEINSLNGSVKLDRIGKYALVNAANGEINASFSKLNNSYPISLVTMNGGVTATLPKASQRDLRLISRKNGYVETDFTLSSDKPIINLNVKDYSKHPIINTATINGGGSLLFLSTENGPIAIKKS